MDSCCLSNCEWLQHWWCKMRSPWSSLYQIISPACAPVDWWRAQGYSETPLLRCIPAKYSSLFAHYCVPQDAGFSQGKSCHECLLRDHDRNPLTFCPLSNALNRTYSPSISACETAANKANHRVQGLPVPPIARMTASETGESLHLPPEWSISSSTSYCVSPWLMDCKKTRSSVPKVFITHSSNSQQHS